MFCLGIGLMFWSVVLVCQMDGDRLLQQVRRFALEQVLPAIALTAYAGKINRQTALASGYQQHLSEPIEPKALISAVTELISPRKSPR